MTNTMTAAQVAAANDLDLATLTAEDLEMLTAAEYRLAWGRVFDWACAGFASMCGTMTAAQQDAMYAFAAEQADAEWGAGARA